MQLTTVMHPYLTEVLRAISLALELDQPTALLHGRRVAAVSSILAERALPEERSEVFCAGLLHDVGAVGMTERLFANPLLAHHPIDRDIDGHAWRSAAILAAAAGAHPTFRPAPCLVLDHHEWWNGRGYPSGKFGSEISLGAQLIRIADSLALAMHEAGKDRKLTLNRLGKRAGKEFYEDIFFLLSEILDNDLYEQLEDIGRVEELCDREIGDLPSSGRPQNCELDPAVEVLVQMLEAKHNYTAGHSKRVALHSRRVASSLNLSSDEIRFSYLAGLLHDVGKIAAPRSVLNKPGPLSKDEWRLMLKHPLFTEAILKELGVPDELLTVVRHVHERWDGTGYPDGISGEEIPLASRIVAVCDTFEGITSHRPYRQRATLPEALEELRRAGGSQFDPAIVEAAAAVVLDQLFLD